MIKKKILTLLPMSLLLIASCGEDREKGTKTDGKEKGGSSYVLAGRFLLHQQLRCNMEEADYEEDREWSQRLRELHPNGTSFRMKCGYKLEE